jgi:hypothetical protein
LHQVELAWALVDATRDGMKRAQRIDTCVAIGSGDTRSAIRD